MIKKVFYKNIILGSISILLLGFLSCESEKRPEEIIGDIPEELSFADHIQPIFDGTSVNIEISGKGKACTECHNGGVPPDLTAENSYIELTGSGFIDINNPESSELFEKMDIGGSMNKYTNLTDIALVLEWIKQGAEDN